MDIWIKMSLLISRMFHLRIRVLLKQMSYCGIFKMSLRYNSYKSALLVTSPNRHALILPQLDKYPLILSTKRIKIKR